MRVNAMARVMKAVTPKRHESNVLAVTVDPLKVARGHRALPRGGAHRSARRPGRAADKRLWRKEL
jgi:hypothetical protein